jgi:hypothetical protein
MNSAKINQLWKDAGWRGALTILMGSPLLSNDGRVWQHVNLDREEIQFLKILCDGTFSSGERTLIEIAASLFNQDTRVNLWEAFNCLDYHSAKLAITAMCNFARLRAPENPLHRNGRQR